MFKRIYIFSFWVALSSLLFSCLSESNEFGEAIPKETNINYFPLKTENEWNYEVENFILNRPSTFAIENLKVIDSIFEYETPGYVFSSNLEPDERGFANQLLTQGLLNKVEGKLVYNGDFIFIFPEIGGGFEIPLVNFILLNQNVEEKKVLQSLSGEKSVAWSIDSVELPVQFNYQLQMIAGNTFKNHSTLIADFENVITSILELKLSATALNEQAEPIEIIEEQKVLEAEFYFAKEVGIIFCKSDVEIHLKNLEELGINSAPSLQGYQTQTLKQFHFR